jgi:hypothetical protein
VLDPLAREPPPPTNPEPSGQRTDEERIRELIHRRRRQILVHSILYYQMDRTLITDAQFDTWARELAQLQHDHPQVSEAIRYHRAAFRGFNGATGYNLPLNDPRAISLAHHLVEYESRTNKARCPNPGDPAGNPRASTVTATIGAPDGTAPVDPG